MIEFAHAILPLDKYVYICSMTYEELYEYFTNVDLPEGPIFLNKATKIGDVRKFVQSHLTSINHNPNSPTAKADYDRLIELKSIIESQKTE